MNLNCNNQDEKEKKEFNLISVNWHLWPRCVNNCLFCFGRFNEIKRTLKKTEALKIIKILAENGTEKISFTGGEPLLCPHLSELIKESKEFGLTTMLITSGTILEEQFIQEHQNDLDWIALSIDSSNETIQKKLGRGKGNHVQQIKEIAKKIEEYNIYLKINTVVTKLNWFENMSSLIEELNPVRWKVFQVLKIMGQNEKQIDPLLVTDEEFNYFVNNHSHLKPIFERNTDMTGSYIMLDPLGRFFQNTKGYLEYSKSILDTDPKVALSQVGWNAEKFFSRGGFYNWKKIEGETS